MHCQHGPGPTPDGQFVVAPSGGEQHQWQRSLEAHPTTRVRQPHMSAHDLCRPDHPGIAVEEDAPVPVRLSGVGDNLHVGERLFQGIHDCTWTVSFSKIVFLA